MQDRIPIVLLPGTDGTGELFESFVRTAPARFATQVVPLGSGVDYTDLCEMIQPLLPTVPFVLLGESFSGPLAVRLAEVTSAFCVVLCNSFVTAPRSAMLTYLPLESLLSVPMPLWAIRRLLAGTSAPRSLVRKVREVIHKIPPRVLAARLNSMLLLEGADRTNCRVLYLRGTHDRVVPERVVRETLAHCPNHTRVNIEAAHLLLQTAPEDAWEAINAFVGSSG